MQFSAKFYIILFFLITNFSSSAEVIVKFYNKTEIVWNTEVTKKYVQFENQGNNEVKIKYSYETWDALFNKTENEWSLKKEELTLAPNSKKSVWMIDVSGGVAPRVIKDRNFKYSTEILGNSNKSNSENTKDQNSPKSQNITKSTNDALKLDKYGLVEEPILDPEMNARLDEELAAAAKGRDYLDRKREEDFEKIRHEKIEEWKQNLRNNKASFKDHPDVQMMSVLSGTDGILMAPSVAKQHDQAMMDKGWYPFVKPGDVNDTRYARSNRTEYDRKVGRPEGIPKEIYIPTYNSVKDYYLELKEK